MLANFPHLGLKRVPHHRRRVDLIRLGYIAEELSFVLHGNSLLFLLAEIFFSLVLSFPAFPFLFLRLQSLVKYLCFFLFLQFLRILHGCIVQDLFLFRCVFLLLSHLLLRESFVFLNLSDVFFRLRRYLRYKLSNLLVQLFLFLFSIVDLCRCRLFQFLVLIHHHLNHRIGSSRRSRTRGSLAREAQHAKVAFRLSQKGVEVFIRFGQSLQLLLLQSRDLLVLLSERGVEVVEVALETYNLDKRASSHLLLFVFVLLHIADAATILLKGRHLLWHDVLWILRLDLCGDFIVLKKL